MRSSARSARARRKQANPSGSVMAKDRTASGAGKTLVPRVPSPSERETLNALVASLSGLNVDQLRLQWRNHLGGNAPAHLPGWLIMRVLAYRIQTAEFGDLDRAILRRLRGPRDEAFESGDGRPFATRGPTTREGVGLKAGSLLVREWNGRPERVMILDDGYAWNGCVYRSLSQVAKAITGTSWNGHRFFRLKTVTNGASSRKRSSSPGPDPLPDIAASPTRAAFAPVVSDPALRTEASHSTSPNASASRLSCEGGPKARQIGSRKDPRSDLSESPRQAQSVQEVRR